ncbi:type ISP restriction/modification enzyme [Bradyrhizobium sp. 199]|uniref:DEAD/DEAH box helicase n=1 Tax=Bradyrhizobium sp. 199 TaxID=2782664 RepID=UPI001FFB5833|nr:type ISP restriction/modification enzyme [Bradyrhizobium sp. 199]MCK1362850.1 DEAD/DEAH box helicase [Bradyrhizobium sp. 199]
MVEQTLQSLLQSYRDAARTERDKGTYFERFAIAYLVHDPVQFEQYERVETFSDWATTNGWDGRDTGIDLVAKLRDEEGFAAIQCKFYDPSYRIRKEDIDSFISASGKPPFKRRVIIDSTERSWSENAETMIRGQAIPVLRINLSEMQESPIRWETFAHRGEVVLADKKKPLPHQRDALAAVRIGLTEADRGKLIMACGTGKTFTSLKIAEELAGAGKSVLFLVPSLALMSQTVREWTADTDTPLRSFAVCSDTQVGKRRQSNDDIAEVDVLDLAFPATTSAPWLARSAAEAIPEKMTVVFATYQSIQVIADAQKWHGLPAFDLIICDEAHRTTGATLAGDDESNFVKIHNHDVIAGRKRLYMTATPRVFGDAVKSKANEASAVLCSMDDESLYGKTLFTRGFGWAVENGLLADYKVMVLAVDEQMVSGGVQNRLADGTSELKLDDATKIIGCYKALTKHGLTSELLTDPQPMKRALAFCKDIAASKLVQSEFAAVISEYLSSDEGKEAEGDATPLECQLEHVDGTFNAKARTRLLDWLKEEHSGRVCRILTNARCLSEGVDVPTLDAVLFMHPRKSQIDVVQSVGRVMRRALGKNLGYVILPIGVPTGVTPEEALNDNERYRVVWQILNALRSHDERFDAMINKADLGVDVSDHIEVIAVSNKLPARKDGRDARPDIGYGGFAEGDDRDQVELKRTDPVQGAFFFDEFSKAIMAKIVKKCGRRDYWEDWATDIAKIAQTHITRITGLVEKPGSPERAAFERFLAEIRDDLNDSISEAEAIEMLAQHLITRPVFEALFEGYSFAQHNPVSKAMQAVLEALHEHHLEKETESLDKFYESVKRRASGIDRSEAKQKIIVELYDKFFRNAFPKMTERLGIVYTPIEIVDFIIRSVAEILQSEFGQTLGSKGVHIIDPFTGTGTFITRLLQSDLIRIDELTHKYRSEIHANEIVLLAYYIAAINIEAAYHGVAGGEYVPFEGICLTDTFQLYEQKRDLISELMADNSNRRTRQKALDIQVVFGNPPYSGQQDSENENNKNIEYPGLDGRIRDTYARASNSKLAKSNYDSYVRAIRWASDRIKDRGIIGFVTNGSFIDAKNMDGLRKSLAGEFSHLFVFDLRGDQRTSGEASRREGGKVFGSGSRTPVAITLMVKNPATPSTGEVFYYDIGDYLSREDKLKIIAERRSASGITWSRIVPNESGDWINQRDPVFQRFLPLAERDGENARSIFSSNSYGVVTNRDPWVYNSSIPAVEASARSLIAAFNGECEKYRKACEGLPKEEWPALEDVVSSDPKRISWSRALKKDAQRGKTIVFNPQSIVAAAHRPFGRQFMYFDRRLNEMVNLTKRMFPTANHRNIVISCTGVTDRKGFSCLVTDQVPSMHLTDTGMCYPLHFFEERDNDNADLFGADASDQYIRKDGISEWALALFQSHYGDPTITKEDIFWCVYGLLHSPEYRSRFRSDLQKVHPRLPLVADFRAFSDAGRALGALHLNFDGVEPYPVIIAQGDLRLTNIPNPERFYHVDQMKFGGKRNDAEKSTVIYNANITMTNIPLAAYDYVVNGKPALEWVMERQCVSTDKVSGIINDANRYAIETIGDPAYPLLLFRQMITVSLETMKIVRSLPSLGFADAEARPDAIRNIDRIKSDIKRHWGDVSAASIALAIVDGISTLSASHGNTLRVGDILRILGKQELSGDIVTALAILVQSEFAILRSGGELLDKSGDRHRLSSEDFRRVLTLDTVVHPVTRTEFENASHQVVPIFEVATELFR